MAKYFCSCGFARPSFESLKLLSLIKRLGFKDMTSLAAEGRESELGTNCCFNNSIPLAIFI